MLTQKLVEEKAAEYQDPLYEEEVERLESLPREFENNEWAQDDLEWIIKWKVPKPFKKRTLREFRSNPDEQFSKAIQTAVSDSSVEDKIEELTELRGVGVPVASALLLYIDPSRFTVIDTHAWHALHEMNYLDEELSSDPTPQEYELYLEVCRSLSSELNVSLRTLDRALWKLGEEDQFPLSHRKKRPFSAR